MLKENLNYLTKYYFFDEEAVKSETPVFVMIGAYTERVIKNVLKKFPTAKIIVYEAEPGVYARVSTVKYDGDVKFHNEALNDADSDITIYRYAEELANSTFKVGKKKPKEENVVKGKKLSTILKDNGLDHVDVLLMNCEGAEIYALKELLSDSGLRSKIDQICTCYHDEHAHLYPIALKEEIHGEMKQHYEVIDNRDGKVVYYLYKRK